MTTTPPRLGSLFSGVGGLDLAIEHHYGAITAWHSQYEPPDPKTGRPDTHQYAARILARHWPGVPNLGDITAVDWDRVATEHPVDILAGGFPCTDVSLADKRAGLNDQTRSGLWAHMARAIHALQPKIVVIENVRGLLSAPAHTDGDLEPCPWCMGDLDGEPVLRALGAVLGDLADLGFDAEWVGLPASAIGAPHERWREFVLAWPATTANPSSPRLEIGPIQPHRHQLPAPQRDRGDGPRPHLGGAYAPALDRWARILNHPTPRPVDTAGRLNPQFSEWLMGMPGWITSVPAPDGMSDTELYNAQIRACGNGVVPQQALAALELLHRAATASAGATAA